MLTYTVVFQLLNENVPLATPKESANPNRGTGGLLASESNTGGQRTRKDSFKIQRWV